MDYDIVIIGGGLVGASLAAALRNSGLSLALVENRPVTFPSEGWDSRIYAISPGCRAFLEQTGAWQLLDASRVAPVETMRVFGDKDAELEFSAYQMGAPELACILESRELQRALWQVLRQQDNLTLLHPAGCAALKFADEAATLTLGDGRTVNARLVVGADGRDSWVRNQAGISAAPVDYRHHGVVANFDIGRAHRNIAYQWFRPDSILALLPLPGNRVSIVWSVSPEKSAQLLALTHDELGAAVAEAAQHTLGEMKVITPPAAFPLRLLVLPHITAPRMALIGDAAHNMHPLAGQGVNTGFRDARQLAQVLLERGAYQDCGAPQLLRRYERKRKEDIYSMQATTYALKNLFGNDDPLLCSVRNAGLNLTNRIVPLKKMLMRHAFN
jgi:ubiquinone biosynthesis UbiH/UbiF/VisC/COQ6 family hydroxylase